MDQDGKFKKIEIERDGIRVILTLGCADEYAAMMIYDLMSDNLRNGQLDLELTVEGDGT